MIKKLALAALLIMAVISPAAAGQELPRHPPVIPRQTIVPIGTLLVDNYDLAYISYIAYYQSSYVANITGKRISSLGPITSLLYGIHLSFLHNDINGAEQGLQTLRELLQKLAAGDVRDLAMQKPIQIPACSHDIELNGKTVTVYLIPNPYDLPSKQDCIVPETQITLQSALDSMVTLLTFNKSSTYRGKYIIAAVHIPQVAAYSSVIQSILQGKLGWDIIQAIEQGNLQVNETMIEQLFISIQNGSKTEALAALRTLNDYAKRGLIDWDTYAKALKIYRNRFGTPILTQPSNNTAKEEVEVNLTSFITNLQGVVKQAEKARIEYQNKTGGGGFTPPSIHVSPLSPSILGLAAVGLVAVALAVERERLRPTVGVIRAIVGYPPKDANAEWCYRSLIYVMRLRGYPKYEYETPREYLARISDKISPSTRAFIETVTEAYEVEEFAGKQSNLDPKACSREIRRLLTSEV